MFEVGVVAEFEATHHLVGDFGPASLTHRHDYRVEVTVAGPTLRQDGTLLDITLIQQALRGVVDDLRGADLNTLDLTPNPTAEVVARYIWQRVAANLPTERLTVTVWESPEAFARYSAASSRA
jgi:6-pyruvoyltetrahydropterin/6-carboxytetrahydropterin synthase